MASNASTEWLQTPRKTTPRPRVLVRLSCSSDLRQMKRTWDAHVRHHNATTARRAGGTHGIQPRAIDMALTTSIYPQHLATSAVHVFLDWLHNRPELNARPIWIYMVSRDALDRVSYLWNLESNAHLTVMCLQM